MNYFCIDGEWKKETAEEICWSIYGKDGLIQEIFNKANDLLEYIFAELNGEKQIIYAHYGGGSDFLFLLRSIVGRKDCYLNEKEFFQANSKIISFTCYHHGKTYQFRDSYSILPSGLDNLAFSFIGEKKIEDSKNLDEIEIGRIRSQCLNDARLLYRVIESFMNMLGVDELCLTAASQALLDMKQRCDFSKFEIQTKEEYEKFLPWFAGGHVDVYRRYAEPCFQYDIKSCYPASQYAQGCPIGKFRLSKRSNDKKAGLYQIKAKGNLFNPFFFHKTNQKTYWVNSEDQILCTDIELRKLIELGIDFKILNGYEWDCDWDFFKPFVNFWFEYRKQGQAQKEIGKIFLNAGGFGKFAIRRDRESIVFGKGADYYFCSDFDIGVKRMWKDFEYSQIHIGARITAGARILLYEAQEKFGNESICYSDTDSVFSSSMLCTGENYQGNIGQLEPVESYKRGYFLGNKFYGCVKSDSSFKAVLKGFPEKFSEEAYYNALFQNKLNFKYAKQSLLKFKSAIRRASDFVVVKEFLREIKKIEIKRKLCNDGINTLPYSLRGGELK